MTPGDNNSNNSKAMNTAKHISETKGIKYTFISSNTGTKLSARPNAKDYSDVGKKVMFVGAKLTAQVLKEIKHLIINHKIGVVVLSLDYTPYISETVKNVSNEIRKLNSDIQVLAIALPTNPEDTNELLRFTSNSLTGAQPLSPDESDINELKELISSYTEENTEDKSEKLRIMSAKFKTALTNTEADKLRNMQARLARAESALRV